MAKYVFGCGGCSGTVEVDRPMAEGPPEENPLCPQCLIPTRRIYAAVPIKFTGPGFSCSGRFDRPDERLDKEIKASATHDPATGKSWGRTDKEMAKKKSRGLVKKKNIILPQNR